MAFFRIHEEAVAHLRRKDKRLGAVVDAVGEIRREVDPDLFSGLMSSIVSQQISTKAYMTVWDRIRAGLGRVTPETVHACPAEALQGYGLSFRKVAYMKSAAEKALLGELDIGALHALPDGEVIRALTALDGVGLWTAQMLLIFSLQRPDVLSFGDLGIRRGLRMVYRHRTITPALFETYRKRYAPYGTTAGLYLWAVAGGALSGVTDPGEG